MRWRTLSIGLIIMMILIAGSSGLVVSSDLQKESLSGSNVLNSKDNTQESLSLIPHTEKGRLTAHAEDFYTLNFSAEEGEKLHLRVSATRDPYIQILVVPQQELEKDHVELSFDDFEGKISEASNSFTRDLEAHVTVPENEDYSLLVRFPSRRGMQTNAAVFDIIIGRGPFSSMVVRTGGYFGLFILSSSLVVVTGLGIYIYKRFRKKSTYEEDVEEWEKEIRRSQKKDQKNRAEKKRSKKERKKDPDDLGYLSYEN